MQNLHSSVAYVLGNGRSRLEIDASQLMTYGTVYGCNAIYRECDPDYVIAVDSKMVNEIVASGYHQSHSVWTNPNRSLVSKKYLNFFQPHKGWSSGPTALWFACTNGHLTVYIMGFDYQGIDGRLNNVYAGTYNYKNSTDAATFFGNWVNQTEAVIREFKHIKFIRVLEDGGFIPHALAQFPNLTVISYSDFIKNHNTTKRIKKQPL